MFWQVSSQMGRQWVRVTQSTDQAVRVSARARRRAVLYVSAKPPERLSECDRGGL